ncbi:restriction endonuclease subunit S [Limosilactobacillus reuteri]|uniref:restriction endonuclease subunit S n=1 Tax=Limosilactobacillus reuteri TaxID=1598 RepID=UPI002B05E611|nr:restriction endonuclease subunit S [Limosilactobacillus reuteri]
MNVKWEQRKLSSIAHQTFGGGTPSKSNKQFWNGDFPWIQSSDLAEDTIRGVHPNKFITQNALQISAAKKIPKNSIAIVSRVGVGKVALIPFNYSTSQDFLSLSGLKINSQFATYSIHKIMKKTASQLQGTSIKGITKKDILNKAIIFPISGKEQVHISSLLKYVDYIISLQQRKLEFLKEIKKGLLQKMFADKSKFPILRFEGFHNEWEQRKLKNVYQKIGNAFVGTASPYYVDAGHFYLESNNIKNGQINRNHEVFINNSFYQKQSNKLLHTGDLVMVQSGHVGDTAVITQEYNNSAAHALIMFRNPKDKFLSDYLNFYFQNTSAKNKINVLAIGNTIRHVLASDMSRFSVYFPNKDERKYISNLLLKLQYTITLQQSKISQLTILKKYLLQKLFI